MTIKAKQLFILIGNDKSGKTTLQKLLIEKICEERYDRLPTNLKFDIKHPEIKRKYKTISFGNRSYQEKQADYGTVDEYFQKYFQAADISFISSHLSETDIKHMIVCGKRQFYNVYGVFLTNSINNSPADNSLISLLDWDERFVIENELTDDEMLIERRLNAIASNIVFLIVNRTSIS